MKYVIFGDTGGWESSLYNSLIELGLDEDTKKLPEDMCIVHLGDLVHKGPYKNIVKDFQQIIEQNNWVQIIGNHEAQYLGGIEFWHPEIAEDSQKILQEWFHNGILRYSFTLTGINTLQSPNGQTYITDNDPIVMSHAGITKPFHDTYLSQIDVKDWNEVMFSLSPKDIYEFGRMLGENKDAFCPIGPVWAHGVHETWKTWLGTNPEFNQFVGHISPYLFDSEMFFPNTNKFFKKVAQKLPEERMIISPFGNRDNYMLFTDPGYTEHFRTAYQPYIIVESE